MSDHQDTTGQSEEAKERYEQQKCDEINQKGREYSQGRGDIKEQKTGVFEWEIANDVSRFSEGVCNMLGVEQSHTVRSFFSAFQYVPPEEWQKLQDAMMLSVHNKTDLNTKCSAIRSDGTVIQIHIKAKLSCDKKGNPFFMEGTIDDITGQQE